MSIPVEVNRRSARARKKETNCAIFTDVISMVCTLIKDYSLPISVRESLSYGKKELTWGFKPIKKVVLIAGAKRWRGGGRGRGRGGEGGRGRGRGRKARTGKMEESAYPLSPIPLPFSFLPIPDHFRCLLRRLLKNKKYFEWTVEAVVKLRTGSNITRFQRIYRHGPVWSWKSEST